MARGAPRGIKERAGEGSGVEATKKTKRTRRAATRRHGAPRPARSGGENRRKRRSGVEEKRRRRTSRRCPTMRRGSTTVRRRETPVRGRRDPPRFFVDVKSPQAIRLVRLVSFPRGVSCGARLHEIATVTIAPRTQRPIAAAAAATTAKAKFLGGLITRARARVRACLHSRVWKAPSHLSRASEQSGPIGETARVR